MEKDFDDFDNAPARFGLCFKAECASAGECLRALAARDVKKTRAFFRRAERVRVTYGCSGALTQVLAGRVRGMGSAICELACQRNCYHLLRD